MRYFLAYEALEIPSQTSCTREIRVGRSRSTASHCGSEGSEDQRVQALPSVALPAGRGTPATVTLDEAVAGLPRATSTIRSSSGTTAKSRQLSTAGWPAARNELFVVPP